ncbi:MAG: efflux transporter outer membrane subunit [Altibacter sp.]|uniref:efflux transporter outer membrane subunit n=1 Tax=Altibacter sp. TaxID=2024823 RepID=UPI001D8F07D3|nr:efflux transporter outer membrane subunit [Altibacter sp.]MBZ0326529.1 efflux transporter outer membrane subunit [Altibacter sp.]
MRTSQLYRLLILIAVPFLLVSCFAAREYERPENIGQAEYFRTDQLLKDSVSIATLDYKVLFQDPLLQKYIEEGLANNIDIRIAIQQLAIAEAYMKQGKVNSLPTVTGNAVYTHRELRDNDQFVGSNQYEINAGLSWEVDIWGKLRSSKRALVASYLQTVAVHQAVKSRLVANIASTYYQLAALDEQIKITEKTIETRSSGLETTQALKEAGNVTEVGVQQTEAQLYTAQAILIDLKNEARLLENVMSILLGSPMREIARNTLETQQINTTLSIGVPARLLENRPDVRAAEYNLINAFELTNVARSNFYPSITLSASGGLQSIDIEKLFDVNSLFATVVGGLTQPIFNGRKIKTQYEVSQAQQEQAKLNFKYAMLQAGKEVSDALFVIEAASEKIAIKEKELNAYSLASAYSEELLKNGYANYLEVLTARENALNSNLSLVSAKNSRLQAIVDLYEALGGGWQ